MPEVQEFVTRYRHGFCYSMALALSRRLEWPIEALVVDLPNGPHVVHAWVMDDDGLPFDVSGRFERESVHEEFLHGSRRKWSNDRLITWQTSEEFMVFLRQCHGERFWTDTQDFLEREAIAAEAVIEDHLIPKHLPEFAGSQAPAFG